MIEDERIYLRPFLENDYEFTYRIHNDSEAQQWVVGPYRSVSKAIEKEWIQSKMLHNEKEKYFAICMKDDDEILGWTSLNDIDFLNRNLSLGGLTLDPKKKKGFDIPFRALMLLIEYSFDELGMHLVYESHLENHPFSPIMVNGLGFVIEGKRREFVYKHGRYWDCEVGSLLKEEYQQMKQNDMFTIEEIYNRSVECVRKEKRNNGKTTGKK